MNSLSKELREEAAEKTVQDLELTIEEKEINILADSDKCSLCA